MTAQDILDFVQAADVDRDGNISYKEFVEILQEPDKQLNNIDDEDEFQSIGSVSPRDENSPRSPRYFNRIDSNTSNNSNQDSNIDISLLPIPSPIKLKKQYSMTIIQPKGEEILKELQNSIAKQEEIEEAYELALEGHEEEKIKKELELEEDEADRLQEGGRNPKISEDLISFDFTTGRIPRKTSFRGDYQYRNDTALQKYLHLLPQSILMLKTPFTANCGGNRLNQWSVTIQVMFDMFNNGLTPILSTSNQSDIDAILFVDSKGKLIIPNSTSSLGNNSAILVTGIKNIKNNFIVFI